MVFRPQNLAIVLLATCASLLGAREACAFAWGVSPIRLEFDGAARTGVLEVSNDDSVKIGFQMRLMRWSQDETGKDQFEESQDLVYFPRLMTIVPKEKRVIRVGVKGSAGAVEKTYRLFIEEMAEPSPSAAGTSIAVRMRFAVPVFVSPAKAELKGEIVDARQDGPLLRFRVRNSGNRHLKIDSITLRRGESGAAQEYAGGYVLAGATRELSVALGPEDCRGAGPVDLVLNGEQFELKHRLTLDPGRCGP